MWRDTLSSLSVYIFLQFIAFDTDLRAFKRWRDSGSSSFCEGKVLWLWLSYCSPGGAICCFQKNTRAFFKVIILTNDASRAMNTKTSEESARTPSLKANSDSQAQPPVGALRLGNVTSCAPVLEMKRLVLLWWKKNRSRMKRRASDAGRRAKFRPLIHKTSKAIGRLKVVRVSWRSAFHQLWRLLCSSSRPNRYLCIFRIP